jgi:hypothetical protein
VSAASPPALKVSDNGRYLVTVDGQPFFWLGDTAWTLCDVLNPGGYHTYGNTSIWNFGIESYYSKKPRKQALTDPGAVHVSIAARLLKSLPWWRLTPDQSLLASGVASDAGLNVAARSDDGSCVVIYLAEARRVSIRMAKLSGGPMRATWIEPKSGVRTPAGTYPNTGEQSFAPPDGWEDAVLLLEAGDSPKPTGP